MTPPADHALVYALDYVLSGEPTVLPGVYPHVTGRDNDLPTDAIRVVNLTPAPIRVGRYLNAHLRGRPTRDGCQTVIPPGGAAVFTSADRVRNAGHIQGYAEQPGPIRVEGYVRGPKPHPMLTPREVSAVAPATSAPATSAPAVPTPPPPLQRVPDGGCPTACVRG